MSEALPSGGTDQTSGASQAADTAAPAAPAAPAAAPQPAATLMDQAGQQQASTEKDPASQDASKPDESGKPADDKGGKPDANAPQGAPEKYEFKPVEGFDLSEGVMSAFSEVAKELNLSNEAAQKVLDKVAPAVAQQQYDMLAKLDADWVEQVKADKDIGGEKLNVTLSNAVKARDAFGTPELAQLLRDTRLGNHPEMLRFFAKAGAAISEDKFVAGGQKPPAATKDAAERLYGKQT